MRKVVAGLFFAFAAALVAFSYGALHWLWADYQDSPDSTYIKVAAIEWSLAAVAALCGYLVLRRR